MASNGVSPLPQDMIGETHYWREWFKDLGRLVQVTRANDVPQAITVGASPFTQQNTGYNPQDIIVSGGTVSDISLSRDGSTFYTTGLTSGVFNLSSGDSLKVTYTVVPTMTSFPR